MLFRIANRLTSSARCLVQWTQTVFWTISTKSVRRQLPPTLRPRLNWYRLIPCATMRATSCCRQTTHLRILGRDGCTAENQMTRISLSGWWWKTAATIKYFSIYFILLSLFHFDARLLRTRSISSRVICLSTAFPYRLVIHVCILSFYPSPYIPLVPPFPECVQLL